MADIWVSNKAFRSFPPVKKKERCEHEKDKEKERCEQEKDKEKERCEQEKEFMKQLKLMTKEITNELENKINGVRGDLRGELTEMREEQKRSREEVAELMAKVKELEHKAKPEVAELMAKVKELEQKAKQDEDTIKKLQFQIKPVNNAPAKPHMADLDIRLRTFRYWPADSPVSYRALAKAGFYYDTESSSRASAPGCCRCFYCGVSIANWESGDDPYIEHAKSPNSCPFIKQCEGERFIEAVRILAKRGGQVTRERVLREMINRGCCIL